MKVTYVCDRCGAVFGALELKEWELEQLEMDPLTVEFRQDIIKSTETGGLFVYTLCDDCFETIGLNEGDWRYQIAPDYN